jgi:RNA polymerase subunit RPABC4/transcription elongation factor Spt4
MTLIKCPHCGHTVSSVASRCPQCATLLSEYRFIQGQSGALTECRRCARKVLSGATVCPYCGTPKPGRRIPYAAGALLLALVVPALVLVALQQRAPGAAVPARGPEQALQPAQAAPAAGSEPQAAPAPGAGAAHAAPEPREAPPAPPVSAGPLPAAPPATETRWTLDWTNVREARALDAPVVRVLKPGTAVRVGERVNGWWAVYLEGHLVGYAAGSLLATSPPDPLPPDTGLAGRRG